MSRDSSDERSLEVAVLERDGDLVPERLEEEQVVLPERRPLGEAVRDEQRADQLGLAAERADHALADPRVAIRLEEERAGRGDDERVQPPGRLGVERHHHLGLAVLLRRRPEGVRAVDARVEHDLGELGAEHGPGVVEDRDDRGVELRRVLEDARRLVQELQALVLLALRQVRAVRDEDDAERDREQRQEQRVALHDHDREQREARVRERDHDPEPEHLGQLLELRRAAGQGDHERDRDAADERGHERRAERREPLDRARA